MEPNKPVNPYQAPSATSVSAAADESVGAFIPNGQAVEAGRGWGWIAAGWELFIHSPLIWVVNTVIFGVIAIVLQLIPFIGGLAFNIISSAFVGGMMIGADEQRRGNSLEVGHLFAGFQRKLQPLLILGVMYLGVAIALAIIMGVLMLVTLGMSGAFGSILGGDSSALASQLASKGAGVMGMFALIILIVLALSIPILMAFWFAPALVVFHDVSPVNALTMSFKGCLKNIVPFLINGVIFFVLVIIGSIPLGLGLLVVFPLLFATMYTSYREIFIANAD